jgi:hypothetical protein
MNKYRAGVIAQRIFNLTQDEGGRSASPIDSFTLTDKTSITIAAKKVKPAGFEVLRAMLLKIQDFWNVTPCRLVDVYQSTRCNVQEHLNLQGKTCSLAGNLT